MAHAASGPSAAGRRLVGPAIVSVLAAVEGAGPVRSDPARSAGLRTRTVVAAAPSPAPAPHVMVIVEENREFGSVIGNPGAPYVNGLASTYLLATQSFATTHPSLPNYLELIAGTTFGIQSDCTDCSVEGTTLVDELAATGISWRAYMEGMPAPCFAGAASAAGYAKKHDPFAYVRHIAGSPPLCGDIVPASQLDSDLASPSPPDFVWVTPNLCDDGHDCSTQAMDGWLGANLPAVLTSPWYRDGGTVIITWDEGSTSAGCCGAAAGGRVPTLVVSAATLGGGEYGDPVDQAGVLRTVEDAYGVGRLGDSAAAASGELPLGRAVAVVGSADGRGYALAASGGAVFAFGDAVPLGPATPAGAPVVAMARTPGGGGYWIVAADGTVFSLGDARGFAGVNPQGPPVVGLAATPDGGGYWLVAADGGVFAFGDARFLGSRGGLPLAGTGT